MWCRRSKHQQNESATRRHPEGLGFALSSKKVQPLIDKLTKEGSVRPIPKGNTANNNTTPSAPKPSVVLDLTQIRQYLSHLRTIYGSWEGARGKVDDKDLSLLLDSLNRQIIFCETLEAHISTQGQATQNDVIMWDAIIKMSKESAQITQRLNSN